MSEKKQCRYCETKTNPKLSLVDQGWQAVQLWVEDDVGKTQMFSGRACPKHHSKLQKEALEFYQRGGEKR